MTQNSKFDPLYPTDMERLDILRGYEQGFYEWPMPPDDNEAYYHGRKLGFNARHGEIDKEQIDQTERARAEWLKGKFGRKAHVLHKVHVNFGGGMPMFPTMNFPKR